MVQIRSTFHAELDGIRSDVVRLAAMVTERIPWGTEVLLNRDLSEAQKLIEADDELDILAIELEERCYQTLVLQAPMASDMRAIISAIHLVSELERSGDLMVNVAKGMRRLYSVEIDPKLRGLISRMAAEAQKLMVVGIDAYVEGDDGKAAALDDMDDRLDTLHKEYIHAIFEAHKGGTADLEAGVQLALIGRYYERIGDHAVNIGERVRYMVTGWLPEHKGAARAAARSETARRNPAPDEPAPSEPFE